MTRRRLLPIETHNDGEHCSVKCPHMLHRDRPERLFCALTRGEIPQWKRTDRCKVLDERHGIEHRALEGESDD